MCFCFNELRRLGDLCALIHTVASIEERCVLTNSRTVVLSQRGRPGGPRPGADHRGLTETRETRETETETETGREGDTEPASQGSPSKRKGGRVESSDAPQHQEEAEEEESGGGATRGTKKQKVQGGTVGISDESATQQSGSARLSEQDLRELSRKQLQQVAKQHGVKANISTDELTHALLQSEWGPRGVKL